MADEDKIRAAIVSAAMAETLKGPSAEEADPADPAKRKGWERLIEYFHKAAPAVYSDANITKFHGPIPDWCGIFALWAVKTGGVSWVGTWTDGHGIASVPGMIPTASPLPGDVACVKEGTQHMDIVHSVKGNSITTLDGNDGGGRVTGPSGLKLKSSFTAGFYTAFPSPVGTWNVRVGDWTWLYTFKGDGTVRWRDIREPPTQSGGGTWEKIGESMEVSWVTGSHERWDLPLQFKDQQGTLVGQGQIIKANRIRSW